MASIIKSDNGVSSGITGIVQSADSSGQLVLQTTTSSGTATTAVTIDNTQKVTFANSIGFGSNAGITFNNSSALTNSTLNDYETGTWTPVLGADGGQSGQTYSAQTGYYTKVGNLVVATAIIRLTAVGTLTGTYAVISGLPFTSFGGTGNFSNGDVLFGYGAGFASSINSVGGLVPSSSTFAYITGAAILGTAPYDLLGKAILGNSTYVSVTITYRSA